MSGKLNVTSKYDIKIKNHIIYKFPAHPEPVEGLSVRTCSTVVHRTNGFYNHRRLSSVIVSALLGVTAFIEPVYCGWFIVVFLIPIFFTVVRYHIDYSFIDGFLWGIIFFSIHMLGVFFVIQEHGYGRFRFMAYVFLIVYCALYAGLWFWCASYLKNKIGVVSWLVVTFFYFYWVQHGILWIFFGYVEGYPLAWPLLPLAHYSWLLYLLPVIGSNVLLILLLSGVMLLVLYLVQKRKIFLFGSLLCTLPFCVGWFKADEKGFPDYVKKCTVVIPCKKGDNPFDCAQEITYQLIDCCQNSPSTKIIFMPESSFPFPLNKYPEILEMWNQNALMDSKILLLGSHRLDECGIYNSLYCLHKSRIIQIYDKKHLIPFTEFVPSIWNSLLGKTLFLNNKEPFNDSKSKSDFFPISNNLTVVPCICSELFFMNKEPVGPKVPLLCIVNDSWFSKPYFRQLLNLVARYKAQEWQRDIFYISYNFAQCIGKNRGVHDL